MHTFPWAFWAHSSNSFAESLLRSILFAFFLFSFYKLMVNSALWDCAGNTKLMIVSVLVQNVFCFILPPEEAITLSLMGPAGDCVYEETQLPWINGLARVSTGNQVAFIACKQWFQIQSIHFCLFVVVFLQCIRTICLWDDSWWMTFFHAVPHYRTDSGLEKWDRPYNIFGYRIGYRRLEQRLWTFKACMFDLSATHS